MPGGRGCLEEESVVRGRAGHESVLRKRLNDTRLELVADSVPVPGRECNSLYGAISSKAVAPRPPRGTIVGADDPERSTKPIE